MKGGAVHARRLPKRRNAEKGQGHRANRNIYDCCRALTISNPLAFNSASMLVANSEHSSDLIQDALLQSGSSSLE